MNKIALVVAAAFASLALIGDMPAGAQNDRTFGAVDDARMIAAPDDPGNWLVNGGTFFGRYYSTLDQINLDTVKDLAPAWFFEFDTNRGQEAEPIVVDGVMYVTTAMSKVYALDAATGRRIWFFDPVVSGAGAAKACCDAVNRGAAVYKGKVFVGTLDGRLIALDAATGKQLWSAQTFDPSKQYTITGAPRVIKNRVIIGNAGADNNVRGYVTAYDTETGSKAWRFFIVPGNPADGPDGEVSDEAMATVAGPTWFGEWWKYGGGGTAWSAIAYDPEFDSIYIGTGNGSPWNRHVRSAGKGDNLFLASIVALDPVTGKYKWHYQENPGESWDYNSVMPMVLADMTISGEKRKVLLHAPKNGFFYVIDRSNGKLISAAPFVDGITWASHIDIATGRPVEAENARFDNGTFRTSPSPGGAHNWHPMALSAQTGLVYLSVRESWTDLAPEDPYKTEDFVSNSGLTKKHSPAKHYFTAFDPIVGKQVWRDDGLGGGALATAGGLVFRSRGVFMGELTAYRATDGKVVWTYPMPNQGYPAPISYMVNGEQYIAITTGAGGPSMLQGGGLSFERTPGRMVAFKLGGKATLPPDPGAAPPLNPSSETWPAADIAQGERLYGRYCARCHGRQAQSANVVPDLRRSSTLTEKAVWAAVVHDGLLEANGMIGWSHALSRPDVEKIRGYVSQRAKWQKERGDTVPTRELERRSAAPNADQ